LLILIIIIVVVVVVVGAEETKAEVEKHFVLSRSHSANGPKNKI
jgi:hypothetical protein